MQIQDHAELPKFDHRVLPPVSRRSLGDSARPSAVPGMPGTAGSHENWGNFKCHKWGELLRHSRSTITLEKSEAWPSRPTMRLVAVKTEEQQARAMLFRTRDLFVRQRTQLINALRGHLAEHGVVAPQGPANVKVLAAAIEEATTSFPLLVVELSRLFLAQIANCRKRSLP